MADRCAHGKTLTDCKADTCHVRFRQIAVIPASEGYHDRTLYALDQHGRVFAYEGEGWTQLNDDQVRRVHQEPATPNSEPMDDRLAGIEYVGPGGRGGGA